MDTVNQSMYKLDSDPSSVIRIGQITLFLGIGSFMAWACLAPLDQGVPGMGTIHISGERKEIQAFTSGVIENINVREGDKVHEGDVLIRLNKTRPQSQLNILQSQWGMSLATKNRLEAEQAGLPNIQWDPALTSLAHIANIQSAMKLQEQQFKNRNAEFNNSIDLLRSNISGLQAQIKGLNGIKNSHVTQKTKLLEEFKGLNNLSKVGYIPRNKALEAERSIAQLDANIAEDQANIGKASQQISDAKYKILLTEQSHRNEIERLLADTLKDVNALTDNLRSAQYDVTHTEIKSPSAGQVVGLKVHTLGGVLSSGQHVMDIVPSLSPLTVEAKFSPMVLDKLKTGLKVDVHFSSLNRVETPSLEGEVATVSADQLIDEITHQPYFAAEILLTAESRAKLKQHHIDIRPGMPVDVMVKTGERTMLNYLLKPFSRRVLASMKED